MDERKSNWKGPVIAVTMGDPSGIGPEMILKSFTNKQVSRRKIVVVGDLGIMKMAKTMLGIKSFGLNKVETPGECLFTPYTMNVLDITSIKKDEFQPGMVNATSGEASFLYVKQAVGLIRNREIDAIATAPLSKEALHLAGHYYPGHTEIFAGMSGTRDFATLQYDKKLSVIYVSTHIPIIEAISRLKQERIERVIGLADTAITKLTGKRPRIAVAGINPHAGESGQFGNEEKRFILPAVEKMRKMGIDAEGPLPPDKVFIQAVRKKYDIVVAMYHDQGQIPVKLLGLSGGVSITAGLPFVRTSAGNGTAFEIAWKGVAEEKSMTLSVLLAGKLALPESVNTDKNYL